MKPLNARTISLIGFAASQWASERIQASRHKRRYKQLMVAGLALHESGELYAAAPKMRQALATIAKHAAPLALVVILAGCTTIEPEIRKPTARIVNLKIASQPTGAVIFMNGEYMGMTPLTIPVEADAEGNWQHNATIQCQVPHDTSVEDRYTSYTGFPVPKHLLFRIQRYLNWHTASQRHPTTIL